VIVGAGLAGLIAAHVFPRAWIFEARGEFEQTHRALLRFRTDNISKLTGVPFRRVLVRKAIWDREQEVPPGIEVCNRYSRKVLGQLIADRSIWNLEPVVRFVAPEAFHEELAENVGDRIQWGHKVDFTKPHDAIISTAPMDVLLRELGWEHDQEFGRAGIRVKRYRVPRCDVFQTIYFPSEQHSMYRASITGDLLICEFVGDPIGNWSDEIVAAFRFPTQPEPIDDVAQHYGKIAPIDERFRKGTIAGLTREHNIFSLGRFATWRNILLDDVLDDAAVIKRLIHAHEYDRRLATL